MCALNPEYAPEIYMAVHHAGPLVDCYFTNGDVRRYDISPAVQRGGVFAPLADEETVKRSLTVYKGCLAFDLTGSRDPFEIIDFCPDTVYEKSVSILPFAVSAQSA